MNSSMALSLVGVTFGVVSVAITQWNLRTLRKARKAVDEARETLEKGQASVDEAQAALQAACKDFLERVERGDVTAVTTDGTFGMLVVEPIGRHGLRVSVEPFPIEQRH